MKSFFRKCTGFLLSLICILIVWLVFSKKINSPLILPLPSTVFKDILYFLKGGSNFWQHFGVSFARILISFFISVLLASVMALLAGLLPFFNDFISFPVSFLRTVPVISVILIALFWLKSGQLPVFVSVLMIFPVVFSSVLSGFLKKDSSLLQMACVFHLTEFQKFRFIQLPHIIPFFLNALASGFGLSWKVVAAGEVLSLPSKGIGSLLQLNQIHLESSRLLAVTLIFSFICFVCEFFLSFGVKLAVKKLEGGERSWQ